MKVEDKESVEQNEEKMTAVDQQEREQEPADRATSTRELAKDLERTPSGKAEDSARRVRPGRHLRDEGEESRVERIAEPEFHDVSAGRGRPLAHDAGEL